jgi:hypothetical protein
MSKFTEEEIERELSERFPNEPEKIRIHDRIAAVEKLIKERQHRSDDDEDEPAAGDDERNRVVKSIHRHRLQEILKSNEAAALAEQEALAELEELEWEEERRQFEEEIAAEDQIMDQEDIFEMFTNYDEDEGGFSDVWKNKEHRQALMDAIDVEIQAKGRDPLDWRTFDEVGQKFRARMQEIQNDPSMAKKFEREDAVARIDAQRIREISGDNEYFRMGLPKDADSVHDVDSASRNEILNTFAEEYPDVASDPNSLIEAHNYVNREHQKEKIESGNIRRDLGLYQESGEHARQRNIIEQLARERGQDPDDI